MNKMLFHKFWLFNFNFIYLLSFGYNLVSNLIIGCVWQPNTDLTERVFQKKSSLYISFDNERAFLTYESVENIIYCPNQSKENKKLLNQCV